MSSERERVQRLVFAARRIADPRDPLGIEARRLLPASTGLSRENVEHCLSECLETHPSDADLEALFRSVSPAPRALVLLSASVFVAPHRALALALAASERVVVRPSRREPEMTNLLALAAPGLFEVVTELHPTPEDHLFAYGSDETLDALSRTLPTGVVLHRHGHGIGIVVVDCAERDPGIASGVARDVVRFDQRGCLSPRVVLAVGPVEGARAFASDLAGALDELERRIPLGTLSADERVEVRRYQDTWRVAGVLIDAGRGSVSLDDATRACIIPPAGRNVHVRWTPDVESLQPVVAPLVTSVAVGGSELLRARVSRWFPTARVVGPGLMQTPPLDGPVDVRSLQNAPSGVA